MRKIVLLSIFFASLSASAFAISIDGRAWDWVNMPIYHKCVSREHTIDRSGMDVREIKMYLGRQFVYIYIEGRSVSGLRYDRGEGFRKTSIRVSFNSAQSPLNRVRVATGVMHPWQIRLSRPDADTQLLGDKHEKFWARGRYGNTYFYELKVPVFISSKGIHVGSKTGPILRISKKYTGSRTVLSQVQVNSVDMKTHRLVDTTMFLIKKDSL